MTTRAHRDGPAAADGGGQPGGAAAPGGPARTAVGSDPLIPTPAPEPGAGTAADRQRAPENVNVLRSSSVMALATIGSRGTGFLRTLVLAAAVGSTHVGNAYNNANTMPNAVYDLMLGGVLTSVVVPLLVNAAKRDTDRGEGYNQRMFSLAAAALAVITLVATLAASLLVSLYAHSFTGSTRALTVIFAYFFIPQIFFYGMSSLIGGILNSRGSFAAPMWTPIVNNVVVIGVLALFIADGGAGKAPGALSGGQIHLLAAGTTLGIVAQTAALVPALRRVGFRWRPTLSFRRPEVAEIMRMAGPLFGYVATTQIAFIVVVNVADAAGGHSVSDNFSTYTYAWQLFQLPYAIVGISVITALLPRMSAHAAERRYAEVKRDFASGVSLASVIVVPAALVLFAIGAPVAYALLGYGEEAAHAGYTGAVLGIFALGLVPYMMFQLMLRVFYAMHDAKSPMYIGGAVMVINITVSLASLWLLPVGHVVEGVAAAFGMGNIVGTAVSWRILSRRVGGLGGRVISRNLIRLHLASIPSALFGLAVAVTVGVVLAPGFAFGIVTVLIGGGGALLLYVMFCRAFGITEVAELTSGLRARLGR